MMHTAFSLEVLHTATLTPFAKAWSINLENVNIQTQKTKYFVVHNFISGQTFYLLPKYY